MVFSIFLSNQVFLFNSCPHQLLFLWHQGVLGYLWFQECRSRRLPGASWGGWGMWRRAEGPQAPLKDLDDRWLCKKSLFWEWRMKGLVWTALMLWLAVGTWRAADQASAASGIKLVFPAQAPSWTSAVLWRGSWWRDFGLSWAQLNHLLVLHDPKNSCAKQA